VRDPSLATVEQYEHYVDHNVFGAERQIAEDELAGRRVLDLGCGTGRLLPLLTRTSDVVGVDLVEPALHQAREREGTEGTPLICSDARFLPFPTSSFDAVLFAYNGLDFAITQENRTITLQELDRVVDRGGTLVFSSHNPLGELLSPRGVRSLSLWRYRLRYLFTGQLFRRFFRDRDGRRLYHGSPHRVIKEVEATTSFRFRSMMNRTGRFRTFLLLLLFAPFPYYVFEKIDIF
jgi:ubiquinone/menaquinone biosynthesis C-methylase UbiE